MAYDNDFIPGEEEEANGIVFMGTTISPTILGVIIAVLGVGGGIWLAYQFVEPLWAERQQLQIEIAEKETQIDGQGNVQAQIEQAEAERDDVQGLQEDVLSMFASPDSLETLLLDINQQVNQRNANLSADEIRTRLVAQGCPSGLLEDFTNVNERVNGFFSEVRLTEFTPVFPGGGRGQTNAASTTADGYELVMDGSFGRQADQQVKRQTYQVQMQGNFAQTRTVLMQLEQLQPLLVVRDFQSSQETPTFIYDENGLLANCQPETRITTSFRLEALLPLSQEELRQQLQADEAEEEES
ncbi:hypothetical protein E1H12_02500 [Geitlerinema sp. P-1104]|uniref:hypothetical protein n=1 Tax=Geitlerinema sp. P-1104 TaxID=2546230 RepID=UPI001476987B|nr:hypothetical protein [Geitlerinema sp. P-1104]NMG57417.1 hypothetical protein [Geitlerinema sp. P-1104]